MHVGGRGHKHAQVATATLQLFIGFGWKHSGEWGIFNTRAYCFCRWSGAGRLGLWHLFWLGAIVPISHDQTYFNCGRVKRRGRGCSLRQASSCWRGVDGHSGGESRLRYLLARIGAGSFWS